ncbi:hypothetical protein CCHR01_00354 [Colletotrichum chrysophilum]|uniref:Uncharacterized protein n=1 Tax=Colletotrichum chrysophilum TaxID=1836956 RepID=A0AAD9EUD7_9PEZI|nr:hypothetical protein CCHR01_00354 [Colletotrichum chrysophilum]
MSPSLRHSTPSRSREVLAVGLRIGQVAMPIAVQLDAARRMVGAPLPYARVAVSLRLCQGRDGSKKTSEQGHRRRRHLRVGSPLGRSSGSGVPQLAVDAGCLLIAEGSLARIGVERGCRGDAADAGSLRVVSRCRGVAHAANGRGAGLGEGRLRAVALNSEVEAAVGDTRVQVELAVGRLLGELALRAQAVDPSEGVVARGEVTGVANLEVRAVTKLGVVQDGGAKGAVSGGAKVGVLVSRVNVPDKAVTVMVGHVGVLDVEEDRVALGSHTVLAAITREDEIEFDGVFRNVGADNLRAGSKKSGAKAPEPLRNHCESVLVC